MTVMSSRIMKVATETAISVHYLGFTARPPPRPSVFSLATTPLVGGVVARSGVGIGLRSLPLASRRRRRRTDGCHIDRVQNVASSDDAEDC
jgi:hypothetical protein